MSSSPQRAAHSLASASLVSLTKPFTRKSLASLRQILSSTETYGDYQHPQNAAVLIPFCNVNNEPSILFELRSRTLRSHSGEISFPGGRVDEGDSSFEHAALRETDEELGIKPSTVEVLGQIGPPEMNLKGNMRVWPIVGFLHVNRFDRNIEEDAALPSLDMAAIREKASKDEVETTFHLPLSTLASAARLKPTLFRDDQPYWSIDVTDLVSTHLQAAPEATSGSVDEIVDGGFGDKIEVWGLTGWYLSLILKKLKIHQ